MTRTVCLLLAGVSVVAVLAGCGDEEPAFCQAYDDAQQSFPGKSADQNALFFQTITDVAPPEIKNDLQAMTRMIKQPRTFRRVAWDRHDKTVQGWLDTHCGV